MNCPGQRWFGGGLAFLRGHCFFEVLTQLRLECVELVGHGGGEIGFDDLRDFREPVFLITLEVLLFRP